MAARKNRKASLANVVITVLVVVGAFWYFSSVYGAGYVTGVDARKSATTDRKNPAPASTAHSGAAETRSANVPSGQSSSVSSFPGAIPAERVTVTEPAGQTELPPDLQAQVNAAPPELPEDLKRQLTEPPPELPPDLKAQLNAPPPEIPEDIKRALQTPPRIVTIDEVNNPKLLEKNAESGK